MKTVVLLLCISLLGLSSSAVSSPTIARRSKAQSQLALNYIPLSFEANRGQDEEKVKFVARGLGYSVVLKQNQMVVALHQPRPAKNDIKFPTVNRRTQEIQVQFVGANAASTIEGVDELVAKNNYFIGNDPGKWITKVPTYRGARSQDIYPGIDLVFYGNGTHLEYDFVCSPAADPGKIQLAVSGAESFRVSIDGSLAIQDESGTIYFDKPKIYQEEAGKKQPVEGAYKIERFPDPAKNEFLVSLSLGKYDHAKPLIIDPVLDYSTYLGGSADDYGVGLALDSTGNAYIVGTTASLNFPVTSGVAHPSHATCNPGTYCQDVFITKLNSSGNGLVYSTYLGGSSDDNGIAIAVDAIGNAYVTGTTMSSDFPVTPAAFQSKFSGSPVMRDGFVAKLDPTGSTLLYSTYLGGNGEDFPTGIAVNQGNAYVSGFSASTDFPVTAGAFQSKMQGQGSSFVVQLNATGTAPNYSTFLGEVDLFDWGPGIAVDSSGNAYLAGVTLSSNFPVTPGAFKTAFFPPLASNLYLSKLNPTGTALIYSALIGGASINSIPGAIALDTSGNVYVTGAAGPFYPVTPGAVEDSCENGSLVSKLSADGSTLLYSAYLCQSSTNAIAVDSSGDVFLTGQTSSTSFPATLGAFQTTIGNACCTYDAFLVKLKSDFSAVTYSTYFGGNSSEDAFGLALDSSGDAYLGGWTSSSDFPVTSAYQATNAGSTDAFLAKFTLPVTTLVISPTLLNFPHLGIGARSSFSQVTLSNVTTSPISIPSITTTGDFSQTNNCGAQLGSGSKCTVNVVFTPTFAGTRNGTLNINDGTGQQTVALSGTGVNGPVVAFSPVPAFGTPGYPLSAAPGFTSPPLTVTVTNVGNASLSITQISLTNGPGFNFFGNTDCLSAPLAPLGTCSVQVDFSASGFGQQFSQLTFTDNASDSPQGLGLFGNTVAGGVQFSPLGVRFNQQPVGTKSTGRTVQLVNWLGGSLNISSIGTTGDFLESNNCGSTLPSGSACPVTVTFQPTSVGIRQGAVRVTDSSANVYTLPLMGAGTPSVTVDFTITASPAVIVVSHPGQSGQTTLTITPLGGFDQSLNYSCAGLPAGATCQFTSVSPTTENLTVTTTAASATVRPQSRHSFGQVYAAALLPLLGLILIPAVNRKCMLRGALPLTLIGLIALSLLWMAGCGGSGTNGSIGGGSPGTPPGSSTVTVTASTGAPSSLAHTVPITLVVSQ